MAFLHFALLDFIFYTWCEALGGDLAGVQAGIEGEGAKVQPSPSFSTDGGTTASHCYGRGTAKPPECSPIPASDGDGPSAPVSLPALRGYALGSWASGTSLLGLGTGGGRPTINARMAPCGCALCKAPRGLELGTKGVTIAQAPKRCGGRPAMAGEWSVGTPPTARTCANFEGETTADGPHAVAVDWWGRVWDNNPARQPPRPPLDTDPSTTWRGGGGGALPAPQGHRRLVGHLARAGRGLGHRLVAKHPPPRPP